MSGRVLIVFISIISLLGREVKGQSVKKNIWNTRIEEINCMEIPVLAESEVKVFEAESLQHNVGYQVGETWGVKNGSGFNNLQRGDGGYLLKGAYCKNLGQGGFRVVFRLKIDNNDINVWDKIMRLEVFDSTQNEIISNQVIERNYFRGSGQFQNFVLNGDLKGRENHTLEARIWYLGNAYVEVDKLTFIVDHFIPGLPGVINHSSSDDSHVKKLISQAIMGLGFNKSNYDGPNANDLFYVNDYYMAWIDQTGYYGKMNGLWQLNSKSDALDFIENMKFNGRIVNFLAVAEDGNGKWPGSYMGAEHFEVPAYVKENDDNASPVEKGISGWYSVNEANPILGTGGTGAIPWWTCCSGDMNNKQSFAQINPPVQFDNTRDQLQINYMAPLTKGVDADGIYDGDRCQANMLFFNNIRYPVYFKLGYIFYKNKPYYDRTYQIVNPAGNVTLPVNTFMAVIHGILITKIPYTVPMKGKMFSFIQPNGRNMSIDNVQYQKGEWSKLDDPTTVKDLIGGMTVPNASYTISSNSSFEKGNSFYSSLYFDTVLNERLGGDISICKCVVHGNWELGGGLLPNIEPIPAGKASEIAVRRMGFPQGIPIIDDKQ